MVPMSEAERIQAGIDAPLTLPLSAPLYRVTIDQYHHMIAAGILTEDDHLELLEGLLVTQMPKNPAHRFTTQSLRETLTALLPAGYFVDDQEPITTLDSEPEPDIAVIRGMRRDFLDRHPTPADIALVIEVSDSTLKQDRDVKQRIYAAGGIPVYWLINLPQQLLELYTQPVSSADRPHYAQRTDYTREQQVPLTIGNQSVGEIPLADILP
jgi:Uma2 family endonuclease